MNAVDLGLVVFLPKNYFSDKDYQSYFSKWLTRNGCTVSSTDEQKLNITKEGTSYEIKDPQNYLEVLENDFRRDVLCL